MNPPPAPREICNRILLGLPESERKRLLQNAVQVTLPRGHVLHRPDENIKKLYFINRGLISLVQEMRDGRSVEVGARGIEGVTTPEALIDAPRAIFTSVVQIACSAAVFDRQFVIQEMARHSVFRTLIHGYFHVAMRQIGQTSACNRLHSLEERCCRWLLVAHDSAGSDRFPLTHEFLAMMLGAPRSGVSLVSEILRKAGYIGYTRGEVTITDRAGLETAACECYAVIRDEFDQLYNDKSVIGAAK